MMRFSLWDALAVIGIILLVRSFGVLIALAVIGIILLAVSIMEWMNPRTGEAPLLFVGGLVFVLPILIKLLFF